MSLIESLKSQFKALEPSQKLMAGVSIAVILLGGIWISANVIPALIGPPVAQEANSPAWQIAKDINAKLAEDVAFLDVGFSVIEEKPMKFDVNGAVYSPADMKKLTDRLKELRPEEDYELKVELLRK